MNGALGASLIVNEKPMTPRELEVYQIIARTGRDGINMRHLCDVLGVPRGDVKARQAVRVPVNGLFASNMIERTPETMAVRYPNYRVT